MCDCGGLPIRVEDYIVCSKCDKVMGDSDEPEMFREIGANILTRHMNISLDIRSTAAAMFKRVIATNIKRGAPRIGLAGACIHLASIHNNYPITVAEVSKLINKKPPYITSELKLLYKVFDQSVDDYDIVITDNKYINRYILDTALLYPDLNIEQYREPLTNIIENMNDNDILISYHANTRICCILYNLISKDHNISDKQFCEICPMSRNTFVKFNESLKKYGNIF